MFVCMVVNRLLCLVAAIRRSVGIYVGRESRRMTDCVYVVYDVTFSYADE